MEMAEEWKNATENDRETKLLNIVQDIVKHNMRHNAEVEACDLLTEIERLDLLLNLVEDIDHARVCLYLMRLVLGNEYFD